MKAFHAVVAVLVSLALTASVAYGQQVQDGTRKITVAVVESKRATIGQRYTCRIEAQHHIEVRASADGYLQEIAVGLAIGITGDGARMIDAAQRHLLEGVEVARGEQAYRIHEAERAPAEFIAMAAIESPEIVDPDEEPDEGDPAQGERLYKTLCAACHGPTAIGGDLGPSLANRAIIGHAAAYNEIVREGLRTRMPPFKTVLNDQQQRDILVWLRGLPHDAVAQAAQ